MCITVVVALYLQGHCMGGCVLGMGLSGCVVNFGIRVVCCAFGLLSSGSMMLSFFVGWFGVIVNCSETNGV